MDPLAGYRVTVRPGLAPADKLLFRQVVNDCMVGAAIAMTDDHQAAPTRSRSTILAAGQYPLYGDMMKLYGSYTSPYVRHCRIALIQGKMDWQFVEIDASESAERSPTKKVPFLHDGDIRLTDSCSILKYVREKSARPFFKDTHDYDLFCMTNTVLDTSMNLFQLDRDGIDLTQGTYFDRQKQRIESALDALNDTVTRADMPLTDGVLRLACLLEWGLFRHRFDLDTRKGLGQAIVLANEEAAFSSTAIPQRFA